MLVCCFRVGSTGLFDAYPFQVGTRYTLPETNFGMRVGIPYLKRPSLKPTASFPLKMDGVVILTHSFPFGSLVYFQVLYCNVSFREGSEPGHDFHCT